MQHPEAHYLGVVTEQSAPCTHTVSVSDGEYHE